MSQLIKAAALSLAVDIGSTGFVKLVEMIEIWKTVMMTTVRNQNDPFNTQK